MSKFESVKFDDTAIVKSSEAISIALHFEAFILKNMKEPTEERKAAIEKLRETLMWVNAAIAEDQRVRHAQYEEMERQANQKYEVAVKVTKAKPEKKAKRVRGGKYA